MEISLESKILDVLYAHFNSRPGRPEMMLSALLEAIGISPNNKGRVLGILFSMEKKGLIEYQFLDDGSGGTVRVTSTGWEMAEDRRRMTASLEKTRVADTARPCPTTLGELIQRNPDCAHLIQRDDIVREIVKYFAQRPPPKDNHVVLSGQPMVGKTRILLRLCEVLGDEYVPLMVDEKGADASNLDGYLYDLASQLKEQFGRKLPLSLDDPKQEDFRKGGGRRAFRAYWDNLRHAAGKRKPVVMFDEIEYILDAPKLDAEIIKFLDDFVRNPDNGYFILAGSERIRYSRNKDFSLLIGKGYSVRVPYFDQKAVVSFFSALQDYFVLEDDAFKVHHCSL